MLEMRLASADCMTGIADDADDADDDHGDVSMMIYVIYDLRCGDNIELSESRLQISSPRARLSGWPSNHHVQENHDYGQKCQLQAARLTSPPGWSA